MTYTGLRPILPQRNSNDAVHPSKGEGTYSYWDTYNTTQLLEDMPVTNHVPGTGYSPHDYQLTSRWRGVNHFTAPITNVGGGDRLENHRWGPWENKGTGGALVFGGEWGHVNRDVDYALWDRYNDTNRTTALPDPGHNARDIGDPDAANTFGRWHPWVNKGVSAEPFEDVGQTIADLSGNEYGHKDVLVWNGVPSSKALAV